MVLGKSLLSHPMGALFTAWECLWCLVSVAFDAQNARISMLEKQVADLRATVDALVAKGSTP